ncbi:MAG: hypothetical protein KDA65_10480 [Planctomycetaceae bacterium]|nr:hypothetical protein [Planctomycetaceae bacterium]
MVIRFRCYHCQHLFGIGNEAAGQHLDCPSCGHTLHIPKQDGFAAPARTPHPARNKRILVACETLRQTPEPKAKPKHPSGRTSLKRAFQILSKVKPGELQPVVNLESKSLRATSSIREKIKTAAKNILLLLVVTSLGFYWGSWSGARNSVEPELPVVNEIKIPENSIKPATSPDSVTVQISGRIRYRTESGLFQPNAGAILLLLPESSQGGERIPTGSVEHADQEAMLNVLLTKVRALGGIIASTDSAGEYSVNLSEPGVYNAVLLSEKRNFNGPQVLDAEWAASLESYFTKPEDLLATRRIYVERIEVNEQTSQVFDIDLERS